MSSESAEGAGFGCDELGEADKLQSLLATRLEVHVKRKAKDNLQDHWCWHFTGARLGHSAAMMVLLGHVKDDLSPLSGSACLLAGPENFLDVNRAGEAD